MRKKSDDREQERLDLDLKIRALRKSLEQLVYRDAESVTRVRLRPRIREQLTGELALYLFERLNGSLAIEYFAKIITLALNDGDERVISAEKNEGR